MFMISARQWRCGGFIVPAGIDKRDAEPAVASTPYARTPPTTNQGHHNSFQAEVPAH